MIKHIRTYITIVFILIIASAQAQLDNTMFYMTRVPQSNYINIAAQPECKSFLSMGTLLTAGGTYGILNNLENGGTYPPNYFAGVIAWIFPPSFGLNINTPFDVNDFIFPGTGAYKDSLITPVHPSYNYDDFLKKIDAHNYLTFNTDISLLYFGWKRGKNYWTFDISNNTSFQFDLPGDIFKYFNYGNYASPKLDLSGLGINVMDYAKITLGFNRQLTRYLFISARLKYLVGALNLTTTQSDLFIETDLQNNYNTTVGTNYQVKTNIPLKVTLNNDGFVDDISMLVITADSVKSKLYDNNGWAIDLGFSQDYNSALTFYGNIQDLGYIDWRRSASTLTIDDSKSYEYKGLEFDFDSLDLKLPDIDTILSNYNFTHSSADYRTYLPYKIYGGFRYKATRWLHFGFVSRFEKMPVGFNPSYTASINFRPGKLGHYTFTYSRINGNNNNLGFGYASRFMNLQWYFVSDNLIGLIVDQMAYKNFNLTNNGIVDVPISIRNFSFHMGCSFVFGYKDKLAKRVPLLDPETSENYSRKVPDYGKNNKTKKKKE